MLKKNLKLVISLVSLVAVHLAFALKVSEAQSLPAACASANVTNPQGEPIGFLTGPEFLNNGSMTLQDIRDYLRRGDIKSWYAGDAQNLIEDTDSTPTNPMFIDFAKLVFDAADDPIRIVGVSKKPINPQLILTMIRKESSTLQLRKRPDISGLACVAGCGCVEGTIHTIRSQITCAARTLRNRFDELAACTDTPNDPVWNLNKPTSDTANKTQDGINVTPSNAATVAHFPYNPVAGVEWGGGGRRKVGGVALFCILWHRDMDKRPGKKGFANPPPSLTLSSTNPTLTCTDPLVPDPKLTSRTVGYRNVTFSVSGGTPPYTWTVTTNITPTNATISACGANGEDAVLKPPANPGSGIAGVAYHLAGCSFQFGGDCFNQGGARCQEAQYGCNDQLRAGCGGFTAGCLLGCAPQTCDTCKAALAGQGYSFDDVLVTIDGADFFSGKPITTGCVPRTNPGLNVCADFLQRGIGRVIDKRTQSCKPCRLEMQGATVTVTDGAGASVSKTVTVK